LLFENAVKIFNNKEVNKSMFLDMTDTSEIMESNFTRNQGIVIETSTPLYY